MADKTGIEWADATWNPIRGCSRVSEGCRNCYAERVAARFSGPGQPYEGLARRTTGGPKWTGKVRLVPEVLDQPFRWQRPRRIFVNSMSDLFHPDVPFSFVAAVLGIGAACERHTLQILTKRAERVPEFLAWLGREQDGRITAAEVCRTWALHYIPAKPLLGRDRRNVLPNILLGFSAEDQATFDERWEHMREVAALGWRTWVSLEPLLGPVDIEGALEHMDPNGLSWVVAGGESGPGARFCKSNWARSVRDQCVAAGVPFLWKQWGEYLPDWQNPEFCPNPHTHDETDTGTEGGIRVGKKAAGRLLDGKVWDQHPEEPHA